MGLSGWVIGVEVKCVVDRCGGLKLVGDRCGDVKWVDHRCGGVT